MSADRGPTITIHGCTKLDTAEDRWIALRTALLALMPLLNAMYDLDGIDGLTYDGQCPGARPIRYKISIGKTEPLFSLVKSDKKEDEDG
jgi:hypothetical protein